MEAATKMKFTPEIQIQQLRKQTAQIEIFRRDKNRKKSQVICTLIAGCDREEKEFFWLLTVVFVIIIMIMTMMITL